MDAKVAGSASGFAKYGSAVKGAVGLVAAGAIISFGKSAVASFTEANQVAGQTEAVLKSTGGAAGLTAQGFADLAASRSKLTGIDNEAIQAEENWLATFTKVQNAQGQGNDIFNQASAAIQDMATAMNQGAVPAAEQLQSATTLVGKALNDPIKGMSALVRVGVSFTQQQQDQIKALVDSGHAMDAQKLILAELNKEFGGSSTVDTYDRRMHMVGNTIDNVKEKLGQVIAGGMEPLGHALEFVSPLLTVAAANVDKLLLAFAGYKVISFMVSGLGALNFALSGLSTASGGIPLLVQNLAGLSAGWVTAAIGLSAMNVAIASRVAGALPHYQKAVDAASGSTAKFTQLTNESASAGRFAGAKLAATSQQYLDHADAMKGATTPGQSLAGVEHDLAYAEAAAGAAAENAAGKIRDMATASEVAADAAKRQWTAELSLAGGFLGVEGAMLSAKTAQDDLKSSRRDLNKLTEEGKRGTLEYHDALQKHNEAVNSAALAQFGLVQSVKDYVAENGKSKATTQQAIDMVRQYGRENGLTAGEINGVIGKVTALIGKYGQVPRSVKTDILANTDHANAIIAAFVAKWNNTHIGVTMDVTTALHGRLPGQAMGGPVDPGKAYMVGERGPELFVSGQAGRIVPNHDLGRTGRGSSKRERIAEMAEAFRIALAEDRAHRRRVGSRDL